MAVKNFSFNRIPKITDLAVIGQPGGDLVVGVQYHIGIKGVAASSSTAGSYSSYNVYEGPLSNVVTFTPDAVNRTARLTWTPIPGNDAILYSGGVKCWLAYEVFFCSDGYFHDNGSNSWAMPNDLCTKRMYNPYVDGLLGTFDLIGASAGQTLARSGCGRDGHGLFQCDGGDDVDPITWEDVWQWAFDNGHTEKDTADWAVSKLSYNSRGHGLSWYADTLWFRCELMIGNAAYDTTVFADAGVQVHVNGPIHMPGYADVKMTLGFANGVDDDGDSYGWEGGDITVLAKMGYNGLLPLQASFARGGQEIHWYGVTWRHLRGAWPTFYYGQTYALNEFYDCTIVTARNTYAANLAGTDARFVRQTFKEEQGGFGINDNWSAYTKTITIQASVWPLWVGRKTPGLEDWFWDWRGVGAAGAGADWDAYMCTNGADKCCRCRVYDQTNLHAEPDPKWYWLQRQAIDPGCFAKVWQYVSIKLTVLDAVTGLPVVGADVSCYDTDGNLAWNETTDGSGTFTKQDTLRKWWYVREGLAGVITDGDVKQYTPHTIEVEKNGYRLGRGYYDLVYAVDDLFFLAPSGGGPPGGVVECPDAAIAVESSDDIGEVSVTSPEVVTVNAPGSVRVEVQDEASVIL